MMNSDDLKFFSILANHPSMASAARALNISPPSVTQRLQLLEDKLKTKLLDRQNRNSRLTESGQLLLSRANLILDELNKLEESISNKNKKVCGKLRVLAPLGFGRKFIAPVIVKFQSIYPDLTTELELSDNPNWNKNSDLDVIVYVGKLRDSSLKRVQLVKNQRILCASPGYIKEYGMPLHPNDLKSHRCLALNENEEDATRWTFNNKISVRINPVSSSNDGEVIKRWALANAGIMIRSSWNVAVELEQGKLIHLLPDYKLPEADVVALTGTQIRHRSAKTTEFLKFLKTALANQKWQ